MSSALSTERRDACSVAKRRFELLTPSLLLMEGVILLSSEKTQNSNRICIV
ncbi:MAG: hypothetical protein OXB86_04240 [Bdellovibrionales bacterium]|nr:hypothetical protein [Bdellovibrionales bacterium]